MGSVPTIVRNLGTVSTPGRTGLSSVPDQIRERSLARGFGLNLLVVGRRGLGCTTLINSLFAAPLIDRKRQNTTTVTRSELLENGISLRTSIITHHDRDIGSAIGYIDSMNREYFEQEQGLYKTFNDNRVHACIYLLPSDTLTDVEIRDMHELSKRCNLIPVVPKADMYTREELAERKERMRQLLVDNSIVHFVPHMGDGDGDTATETADIAENIPLAVIASEVMYNHGGEILRGRRYPWGFVSVESEEVSDFRRLQRLLIHTCLDELVSRTDQHFYNNYRRQASELEQSSGAMLETRYYRLREEMMKALFARQNAKMEILRAEEDEMERFYASRLGELSVVVDEIERSVKI